MASDLWTFPEEGVYVLFGKDNLNGTINLLTQADVVIKNVKGVQSIASGGNPSGDVNPSTLKPFDELLVGVPDDGNPLTTTDRGAAYVFNGRATWPTKGLVFNADFSTS